MQVLRIALRSRATTLSITAGSHAFAASICKGVDIHIFLLVSEAFVSETVGMQANVPLLYSYPNAFFSSFEA